VAGAFAGRVRRSKSYFDVMEKLERKSKSSKDQKPGDKLLRFIGLLPSTFEVMVDHSLDHCRTCLENLKRDDSEYLTFFTLVDSLQVVFQPLNDDTLEFGLTRATLSSAIDMEGSLVRVSPNRTLLIGTIRIRGTAYRPIMFFVVFVVLFFVLVHSPEGALEMIILSPIMLLVSSLPEYYARWHIFDQVMDAIRETH